MLQCAAPVETVPRTIGTAGLPYETLNLLPATFADRTWRLPNGRHVSQLGFRSTTASDAELLIIERVATHTYDVLYRLPVHHCGAGLEFFDCAYDVPDTGNFFVAVYWPGGSMVLYAGGDRAAAFLNISGAGASLWENGYSTGGGYRIGTAARTVSATINLYDVDETNIPLPGFRDTTGRELVPIQTDQRTFVIVADGQSLIANTVAAPYVPTQLVHNFNFYDGKCYRLADPVLGASVQLGGGSWLGRVGDKLITADRCDRVIVCPMAIDGMAISEWTTGRCRTRIPVMINRLRQAGLVPTHFLWMQGQSDVSINTHPQNYANTLRSIASLWRAWDFTAPFIVIKNSWIAGGAHQNVRDGQGLALSSELNIIAGPDADTIGNYHRQPDMTHLKASGADTLSTMVCAAL